MALVSLTLGAAVYCVCTSRRRAFLFHVRTMIFQCFFIILKAANNTGTASIRHTHNTHVCLLHRETKSIERNVECTRFNTLFIKERLRPTIQRSSSSSSWTIHNNTHQAFSAARKADTRYSVAMTERLSQKPHHMRLRHATKYIRLGYFWMKAGKFSIFQFSSHFSDGNRRNYAMNRGNVDKMTNLYS